MQISSLEIITILTTCHPEYLHVLLNIAVVIRRSIKTRHHVPYPTKVISNAVGLPLTWGADSEKAE